MRMARVDTLLGALFCQAVTIAVMVAAAATIGKPGIGKPGIGISLDTVPQIADAFGVALGSPIGRIIFAVGLSGGALVATVVVPSALATTAVVEPGEYWPTLWQSPQCRVESSPTVAVAPSGV